MINVKAAVCFEANKPLSIETLQLAPPGPGEVLVEIKATGLCHSDLHAMEGNTPHYPFPLVAGHEGAGVVVEVGPGVTSVKPGDHVTPAAVPECRQCRNCISQRTNMCEQMPWNVTKARHYFYQGKPVTQFTGCSTFAQYTVVSENSVAQIPKDVPFDVACLVACGVLTGVGTAVFAADIHTGDSVAVFGLGGIGLNVLQGAKLAGAGMIIGVDINPARSNVASQFGATHFINPKEVGDVPKKIHEMTGGGVHHAFECVGNSGLLMQAYNSTHPAYGTTLSIGVARPGETANFPMSSILTGRTWKGAFLGGARPRTHIPELVKWYQEGRLKLDELVTHRLPLERINEGFDLMKKGQSIRAVVVF